jgi:hypothetical protein
MIQLNPFAIGEQKRRSRATVAALERYHATTTTVATATVTLFAAPGQGPPPSHDDGGVPCLTTPPMPRLSIS